MTLLVFNSGSSSLKFGLFRQGGPNTGSVLCKGIVRGIGGEQGRCDWQGSDAVKEHFALHAAQPGEAATQLVAWLQDRQPAWMRELQGLGHRVVHGGEAFSAPARIDEAVAQHLERLSRLAPLHNPPALQVMRAARVALGPDVPMVAVFDTAFFHGLPEHARRYALPAEWEGVQRLRRYGFHGIAHRYLYERYAELSGADAHASRVVTLQLGQGCSMAAVRGAVPLDTSMGMTPLEGLVMATRCGDVDPDLLLSLMIERGFTAEALHDALNHRAGLLGLSGASADMKELLRLQPRHAGAALAIDVFCHRARKYLGAYFAVLEGADAVVFGGGIGENAPVIRERICQGLQWCGLAIDRAANGAALGAEARISTASSAVAAYVIPVDEESIIARETRRTLNLA
ncbi:MAG: acetate kinase [Betaproteobacteria bacterium RIFCSPLOWO2_12_FULL_66_14]|nr:MAG: acetate kinase [Betaproteobacteria bacterium RIFCSPLOWO2_12_FULL_66_14]